jgi:hypothetical protein
MEGNGRVDSGEFLVDRLEALLHGFTMYDDCYTELNLSGLHTRPFS